MWGHLENQQWHGHDDDVDVGGAVPAGEAGVGGGVVLAVEGGAVQVAPRDGEHRGRAVKAAEARPQGAPASAPSTGWRKAAVGGGAQPYGQGGETLPCGFGQGKSSVCSKLSPS